MGTPRYLGLGADGFTAAPILLVTPAAGALAAALVARGRGPTALAYRALSAGSVTITDATKNVTTWAHQAGEGYAFPLVDVVCAGGNVLVFY